LVIEGIIEQHFGETPVYTIMNTYREHLCNRKRERPHDRHEIAF